MDSLPLDTEAEGWFDLLPSEDILSLDTRPRYLSLSLSLSLPCFLSLFSLSLFVFVFFSLSLSLSLFVSPSMQRTLILNRIMCRLELVLGAVKVEGIIASDRGGKLFLAFVI